MYYILYSRHSVSHRDASYFDHSSHTSVTNVRAQNRLLLGYIDTVL